MDTVTGLNKKYFTLLTDSIEHIDVAENLDEYASFKLYRASIISNVLAVESCANICIQHMSLPKNLYDSVEKLSVIGKFDYFSHHTFNQTIDRSLNEYSILKSLVTIRNEYVHPKVEEGEFERENGMFQFGHKKSFNLSNDIRVWSKDDALLLLNAHVAFMNYYFNTICGYSKGQSNTLLTSLEDSLSQKLLETYFMASDDILAMLGKYLTTPIEYLDIRKQT